MIRLTVDGKNFSCQNIDVLINYDYIRNKTEVKLFNGVEELAFDDKCADFDINIIFSGSESDLAKMVDSNEDFETSVRTIERANSIISRELNKISKDRSIALEIYQSLCKSILRCPEDRK